MKLFAENALSNESLKHWGVTLEIERKTLKISQSSKETSELQAAVGNWR